MTKGMAALLVSITKQSNYNSIVIVHQHGGYDVTCKRTIAYRTSVCKRVKISLTLVDADMC